MKYNKKQKTKNKQIDIPAKGVLSGILCEATFLEQLRQILPYAPNRQIWRIQAYSKQEELKACCPDT